MQGLISICVPCTRCSQDLKSLDECLHRSRELCLLKYVRKGF